MSFVEIRSPVQVWQSIDTAYAPFSDASWTPGACVASVALEPFTMVLSDSVLLSPDVLSKRTMTPLPDSLWLASMVMPETVAPEPVNRTSDSPSVGVAGRDNVAPVVPTSWSLLPTARNPLIG